MNLSYRWVIVAEGAFMGCVAIGSIFSLPIFLQPMSQATGWSRTEISLAMTINFITMGIAAFGWGMIIHRFGPRIVVLSGASILGLGLMLASRASSVQQFQLIDGILVGADDGHRDWLVRPPSQPRCLFGVRRHGCRALDHRAHRRPLCADL